MILSDPSETSRPTQTGSPTASSHEWTDAEIAALARDLESVYGGELTVAALIGVGPRATPFVSDFLLNGAPSAFEPVFRRRIDRIEAMIG